MVGVLGLLMVSCMSPLPRASQTELSVGCLVSATAETVAAIGDPDDPAIWVPPSLEPQDVRILTTDKSYGLIVYNLRGEQLDALPSGKLNNVDIRGNLAFASNRSDTSITWFRIGRDGTVKEGANRLALLETVGSSPEIYGICAYRSSQTGALYVFANFKNGLVLQFSVDDKDTSLNFTEVRRFKVASQPEGMVADDELGQIYVGEEDKGIWRFGAEPNDSAVGKLVDSVGSAQLGMDDVEGLAIYATGPGSGYLLASSQGTHSYALYDRITNEPRGTFRIVSGNNIDNVSETDGLEVSSLNLGPQFPQGILVVQDDKNEGLSKNFKIISWTDLKLPW